MSVHSMQEQPRFRLIVTIFLGALFLSASDGRAAEALSRRAALLSIKTQDLQSYVGLLADDTLEGREAGSRGGRAAAKYLADIVSSRVKPIGTQKSVVQFFGQGFQNIVGVLEGSDPEFRDEFILVGAHYDHVGYGNRNNSNGPIGYIHNGADDNASGTAALLELVDAFSRLQIAPRRSIIFAFWDAEEKGLLGSEHWIANPPLRVDQIKLAINMDMIGRLRDNKIEVLGTRSAAGLRQLVSRSNTEELEIDFKWTIEDNSDHYPFFRNSIPVLMTHTGLHSDYHRPSDDAHLIDSEGIRRITRLIFNCVFDAANSTELPSFRARSRTETDDDRRRFEMPLRQPASRLGIKWTTERENDRVELVVSGVDFGSPAALAGIVPGDRLVAINGSPVMSSSQFRRAILSTQRDATIELIRMGESTPQTLTIPLRGQPFRLGISWRTNEAEPASVTIIRVVAGSPAAEAGLRAGDRIWEVNGQSITQPELFHQTIGKAVGADQITLVRERNGIASAVDVVLD